MYNLPNDPYYNVDAEQEDFDLAQDDWYSRHHDEFTEDDYPRERG